MLERATNAKRNASSASTPGDVQRSHRDQIAGLAELGEDIMLEDQQLIDAAFSIAASKRAGPCPHPPRPSASSAVNPMRVHEPQDPGGSCGVAGMGWTRLIVPRV